MFDEKWLEYFKNESPFAYYCVLFIGFLWKILCYAFYLLPVIIAIGFIAMIVSGVKTIKIKLVHDKQHKKENKKKKKQENQEQENYLNMLHKNVKKKKKKSK